MALICDTSGTLGFAKARDVAALKGHHSTGAPLERGPAQRAHRRALLPDRRRQAFAAFRGMSPSGCLPYCLTLRPRAARRSMLSYRI
jgi:hypothetical protein